MSEPTPGPLPFTPGQINYQTYRTHYGAASWPMYDRLSAREQRAWETAAQAVMEETSRHAMAVVRHWHEFGPEHGFDESVHDLETWLKSQMEDTPYA